MAADLLPTKKEPPAPSAPVASWTGFYLGVGVGFGMGDARTTPINDPAGPALTSSLNNGLSGPIGLVKGGYDYQLNPSFVIGAFGDFDVSHISGSFETGGSTNSINPLGGTATQSSSWSVGARVGWLVSPTVLTYEDAGFTRAHFNGIGINNLQAGVGDPLPGSIRSNDYNGWFIGGGVEAALPFLAPGWFIDTEYRYSNYDGAKIPILNAGAPAAIGPFRADMTIQPNTQTITTSLVYKFGMAPVAGAYAATPTPPSEVKWTGFYVGAGVGYGLWDAKTSGVAIPGGAAHTEAFNNGGEGWLGLVKAGYDYQLNHAFVVGAFGEYDVANLAGTVGVGQAVFYFDPLGGREKETSHWAVGGRIGWLVDPNVMAYGQTGFAQAHFDGINIRDLSVTPFPGNAATPSRNYNGWFIGVGTEARLTFLPRGWFVDTAYRYTDYASAVLPLLNPNGTIFEASGVKFQPREQNVTTSLVYRF